MKKELLRIINKEIAVQVSNNSIKAIRNKDIVKVGARIYDNGLIGVAGQYGDNNIDELFKKAKNNLGFNIKYPCNITTDAQIKVLNEDVKSEMVLEEAEQLVINIEKITNKYGFIASGNIKFINKEVELTNEENLNCICSDKTVLCEILLKEVGTPNIFDTGYFNRANNLDSDIILKGIEEICIAHKNHVELPSTVDGKIRCIFSDDQILTFFIKELSAQRVGTKSSYFNNKFGEKIFNEDVTLYPSKDLKDGGMPFDFEGTEVKGEDDAFILNGVLLQGYSDKRDAEKYGVRITGSGFGDFNSVPASSPQNFNLKRGNKTLKELIGERPAILILSAGGGDFTNDGGYGTPVQIAYLFDGEKFIGLVPEFSIKSHIYDMYGKDFVGVASDGINEISLDKLVVMDMKLN